MTTLTKKDLLEAIEDMLTKIKRYFCPCNNTYLSDRFIVNGHEYYELTCPRCGKKNKPTNMLTERDYCDYDTCAALKELGYIGQGRCYYDLDKEPNKLRHFGIQVLTTRSAEALNFILAPKLYEAQKWLREEKEVYVTVIPEYNDYRPIKGVKYRLEVAHWKDDEFGYETIEWLDEECLHTIITFDSYEEALSEGIKEAVKILKEK